MGQPQASEEKSMSGKNNHEQNKTLHGKKSEAAIKAGSLIAGVWNG